MTWLILKGLTQSLCPTCPQAMCCKVTYGRLSQIMVKVMYANGNQNGEDQLAYLFGLVNNLIIGSYGG